MINKIVGSILYYEDGGIVIVAFENGAVNFIIEIG